jgi:hypothetical protein
MEPIISLPYSEFATVNHLRDYFPKKKFAILIPDSRQQKNIDCAILNINNKQLLTLQIKSSRVYNWEEDKPSLRPWYTNFRERYRPRAADMYLFFSVYPTYTPGSKVDDQGLWKYLILAFWDKEMPDLLKKDTFIQFGFDVIGTAPPKRIKCTRGGLRGRDVTYALLDHRIAAMLRYLR